MSVAIQVLRCDIIIVGIGFNMLASGVTLLLLNVVYGEPGTYAPFDAPTLPRISLGPLESVPLLGEVFHRQSILILIILVILVAAWVIEKRSVLGTHIAAVGANVDVPRGATEIDATGLYVMPGIVDAHSHIAVDGSVNGTYTNADSRLTMNSVLSMLPISPTNSTCGTINNVTLTQAVTYQLPAGLTFTQTVLG